jgi:hypothetical protein
MDGVCIAWIQAQEKRLPVTWRTLSTVGRMDREILIVNSKVPSMEDAHATGTDEKPNHDQHNAPQKLFSNDSENAADDQDHRDDPQNGGHSQTPFTAP